jgi:hypothetical protein
MHPQIEVPVNYLSVFDMVVRPSAQERTLHPALLLALRAVHEARRLLTTGSKLRPPFFAALH